MTSRERGMLWMLGHRLHAVDKPEREGEGKVLVTSRVAHKHSSNRVCARGEVDDEHKAEQRQARPST